MKSPAQLADEIRDYGYWQGPDEPLDALVAYAEEVRDAARDVLEHVPLPVSPTGEDLRRIVRLDVAAR